MATLIDLEPFKAEAMPALQDPPASDALGRVQSLQKLCLKAIGRRLQRFCNLRLHPTLAQTLSTAEKQLICSYDLSRLDVFEAQAFLQTIDKWCTKVERSKRQRHGDWTPKRVDRAMKGFLRYVLLPPAESQLQEPFRELALALGLVAGRKLELRAPTPSVKPRRKWVSGAVECQNDIGEEGTAPSASSPEVIPLDEIVYFRLPVASVGCGIIAEMLQHSSSIVKLRLNNCHITDAGAILLASGIRLATMLELLDVSNEESVYWKGESMDNEIRNNGVRAIALALERNQSVKQVDLSGNPVRSTGGIALASMLRKNVSLQRLYLNRTFVQDCAETLIDVFQESKSLNRLSMQWCRLRPGVGAKLASVQAAKICHE